jgi:hypothetical protein
MPYRNLPSSDAASLTALRALVKKQLATPAADWLYDATLGAENTACLALFTKETGERETADAARIHLTELANAAFNRTRQTISHFIQTLNNGIDRAVLVREDRSYYNLGLDQRDVPVVYSTADVITWANNVIAGETRRAAAASAAGRPFIPVTFPSAADVQTELSALESLLTQQSTATTTAQDEQHDVEAARPRIALCIVEAWDAIEYRLRRLDAPALRDIARQWGITYASRPGEPPEAGVSPAPSGTPVG